MYRKWIQGLCIIDIYTELHGAKEQKGGQNDSGC